MNRTISLRPEARRDIAEIWIYTERHWGEGQASAYVDDLMLKIGSVAENRGLGSDSGELFPNLRRVKCGSHSIYYLATADVLDVVRILHLRRDAEHEL